MLQTTNQSDEAMTEHEPMTVEELLAAAEPIVRQACRTIAQRFRGYIEFDDLAQEARLWCLQHQQKLSEWLDCDPDDKAGFRRGAKKLSTTLSREAERAARRERAAMLGYRPEDEWFANRGTIKELLPVVIGGGYDGYEVSPKEAVRSPGDPAEGNNKLALLADVAAAWKAHPSAVLERLYHFDVDRTRPEVAESMNITPATLAKRENQALDMLIRFLGGANPYGKNH